MIYTIRRSQTFAFFFDIIHLLFIFNYIPRCGVSYPYISPQSLHIPLNIPTSTLHVFTSSSITTVHFFLSLPLILQFLSIHILHIFSAISSLLLLSTYQNRLNPYSLIFPTMSITFFFLYGIALVGGNRVSVTASNYVHYWHTPTYTCAFLILSGLPPHIVCPKILISTFLFSLPRSMTNIRVHGSLLLSWRFYKSFLSPLMVLLLDIEEPKKASKAPAAPRPSVMGYFSKTKLGRLFSTSSSHFGPSGDIYSRTTNVIAWACTRRSAKRSHVEHGVR